MSSSQLQSGAKCTIAAIVFWAAAAFTSNMARVREEKDMEGDATTTTEPLIPGENF